MTVYLLHFDHPDGSHKHYSGFTSREPEVRLAEHVSGKSGSKFTAKLVAAGYVPRIAHLYKDGDRTLEYRLKTLARSSSVFHLKRWCPICGTDWPPTADYIMENGKGRRRRAPSRGSEK